MSEKRTLGAMRCPGFEWRGVFGPLEWCGMLLGLGCIIVVAEKAGPVRSAQGPETVAQHGFDDCPRLDMLLVPGGFGTRTEVDNPAMLDFLRRRVPETEVAMTVCTGTSLFAKAGLLDGHRATTNKMFFQWVSDQGPKVNWVRAARWVEDGRFATSSGVSAGLDMSLAVISRLYGAETAKNLSIAAEYDWHRDADWDPFAKIHGLV